MTFSSLITNILKKNIMAISVSHSGYATQACAAQNFLSRGRNVVIVAREDEEQKKIKEILELLMPDTARGEKKEEMPLWEHSYLCFPSYFPLSAYTERLGERLGTLYGMKTKAARIVIVTPDAFFPKIVPQTFFHRHSSVIHVNQEIIPDIIVSQAVEWGYKRSSMVTNPGEIASRGDILDIFLIGYPKPIRLEFFGDILEEMRFFDTASQRSTTHTDKIILLPASEIIRTPTLETEALSWWGRLSAGKTSDGKACEAPWNIHEATRLPLLPGWYYPEASSFGAWLPDDPIFILPPEPEVDALFAAAEEKWRLLPWPLEYSEECQESALSAAFLEKNGRRVWENRQKIYFQGLVASDNEDSIVLPERHFQSFSSLFPSPAASDRPWQTLLSALGEWKKEGRMLILSFATSQSRKRFFSLAGDLHMDFNRNLRGDFTEPAARGDCALISSFRDGVWLDWANTLILGENVIQPKIPKGKRVRAGAFRELRAFDSLAPGDLLVHRDYGIGEFCGLKRLEIDGIGKDFLLLHYAGQDKLYLPVDRLSLVQLYKGPEGVHPQLDRLGSQGWQASKEKARKAIEKVAKDLVEMYAYRKIAKGFTYDPPSELYREFEASFSFEETPDQTSAIQDVLADMERKEPMDRLVCGDVGFGKTEVALRAAFRAVSEGKQVALLCPTTILAEQHFQTFRARLAPFPVSVEVLSRFVSPANQKSVIARAQKGLVDILIGTHRILSSDVVLPNLSLLILDEEQRFGVRHKEKLKQIRKNVDVLALSATPIPRTLQLSISGIRDLSIIETAPPERKPVATMIVNRDEGVLRSIVERELARDGQVFWVHNRVQGLEEVMAYVRRLAPKARIDLAHGQMPEAVLEEAMRKFWHHETDILISTSIIESGLDLPRANTLIVDQAQMFGLGQLYQLRGRVGRSDKQAYAAFVVNDASCLSDLARERLRIIRDMDYLGAGFQVAMEDLRLRGAGNILGEVQSGQMAKVGLDLYLEMLGQEISRLKGEAPKEEQETEVSVGLAAYIPDTYIIDTQERLRYYKALSSVRDEDSRRDIELEIRDRFGVFPEELTNFIHIMNLKCFLTRLGVKKADVSLGRLKIFWPEGCVPVEPAKYVAWIQQHKQKIRVISGNALEVIFAENAPFDKNLEDVSLLLNEIFQAL